MKIFEDLKLKVVELRTIVDDFKDNRTMISVAVSKIVDSLPPPFNEFGSILWEGLENKSESAQELLDILQRIEGNNELEFMEITTDIRKLMKTNPTKQNVLQISKQIRNSEKSIIGILGDLIRRLEDSIALDMTKLVDIQKEMCQILREQNIATQIDPNLKLKLTKEFEEKIRKLEEEKSRLQDELEKAGQTPKIDADLLLRESNFYFDKKEYDKTITFADAVLVVDPKNYLAWYNKGCVLVELERYEEAVASYDKAVQIKQDYHEAWNNKGTAWWIQGNHQKAIECFEKTLKINPNNLDAKSNLELAKKFSTESQKN